MIGAGKYDDLTTTARRATMAQGVILIVLGGSRGSGFSVQATPDITALLPKILRDTADNIEDDLRQDLARCVNGRAD